VVARLEILLASFLAGFEGNYVPQSFATPRRARARFTDAMQRIQSIFANGRKSALFGHSPQFIDDAVRAQPIKHGVRPQSQICA